MFLKNFKFLLKNTSPFGVALYLKGTLECPVCQEIFEAETEGHTISGPVDVTMEQRINWEIEELTVKRYCPKCGVVSLLPEKDEKKLRRKAREKISEDWLEKQLKNLRDSSEKKKGAEKKRSPGLCTKDGKWLVITESKGDEKTGYTHKCGEEIIGKNMRLTVRDGMFPLSGSGKVETATIPFCPECEKEPQGGEINPSGKPLIW